MQAWTPTVANCDQYMNEREGKYEYRAIRYRAAIDWMIANGLDDTMTVVDVGAGMTEFDYCLRAEYGFRGRYIPVDGGIDGTDLNVWTPPRQAHFFVALELVEHLTEWKSLLAKMKDKATVGVVLSTPDPVLTDVLAMDPTHVTDEIDIPMLMQQGMNVGQFRFYGGVFNRPEYKTSATDAFLATWKK